MMGCDGTAEGHPETGELAATVGGVPMDRCPMALLRDGWTAEMVALRKADARGGLGRRCAVPSAKTCRALDALEAFEEIHRAIERHDADPDAHPPVRLDRPPWEMI